MRTARHTRKTLRQELGVQRLLKKLLTRSTTVALAGAADFSAGLSCLPAAALKLLPGFAIGSPSTLLSKIKVRRTRTRRPSTISFGYKYSCTFALASYRNCRT